MGRKHTKLNAKELDELAVLRSANLDQRIGDISEQIDKHLGEISTPATEQRSADMSQPF